MSGFRTRHGRCTVTEDSLEINSGALPFLESLYIGSKPVFAVVVVVSLYVVLSLLLSGPFFMQDIAFIGVGLFTFAYLLSRFQVYISNEVTREKQISIQSIDNITHRKANLLLGSAFVVEYESEGKTKKRIISLLPGWFSNGERETEKAKQIFSDQKIPIDWG